MPRRPLKSYSDLVRLGSLCASALLTATAVGLTPDNPHLAEAMALIDRGDLAASRTALDRAMAHPENTNRDLVEIYSTLAVVHLYGGEPNLAYDAYARLLNIDPNHRLPLHTAEPLVELFERVTRAYEQGHLKAVRVAHDPPGQLLAGVPASITATVSNMPRDFVAIVRYRASGEPAYETLPLSERPGNRWVAVLPETKSPEPATDEARIEYYVEVINANGHRVQGSGNARSPHELRIVPALAATEEWVEPAAPWYGRPWFWVSAGGVLAGSMTIAYFGLRSSNSGTIAIRVRVVEDL